MTGGFQAIGGGTIKKKRPGPRMNSRGFDKEDPTKMPRL